jgi:hypothetical protein
MPHERLEQMGEVASELAQAWQLYTVAAEDPSDTRITVDAVNAAAEELEAVTQQAITAIKVELEGAGLMPASIDYFDMHDETGRKVYDIIKKHAQQISPVMSKHSALGASDTEPEVHAVDLIEAALEIAYGDLDRGIL